MIHFCRFLYRNLQKCIIFNISPKISHSFQGIHYMVNLWKQCVYSIVRYWYHAQNLRWVDGKQFGCKIKVADRCDSRYMYSILPFGAIKKICFIFINHIYLTLRSRFHFILINMIFTIEADFRLDTKWRNTAPWVTVLPFCFGAQIVIRRPVQNFARYY